MPIRGKKLLPSSFTEIKLYVDSYDNNILGGRIHHTATDKLIGFLGIYNFLETIERIYDKFSYPQATHELRSFRKSAAAGPGREEEILHNETEEKEKVKKEKEQELDLKPSAKGTFIIKVMYRQNATWQGSIQWIEGKKTQNFRSDLEMLKLIDDALRADDKEDDMVKWE